MATYLRPRRTIQTSAAGSSLPAAFSASAPSLGYGNRAEVSIDKVNQWMRGQPWYQQTLASFGQSADNVHLTDDQKHAVIRAAQANGVVVDEGGNGQEIDDSGNFRAKGHKLRNTLIVAGIAAAAIAAPYVIPAIAGGGGSAAGAAATLAADPWYGVAAANLAAPGLGTAAFGGVTGGVTAASLLGPSTPTNLASTSAVANGAPAGIAATGGTTAATVVPAASAPVSFAANSGVPPAVTTGHMTAANFLNSPGGTQLIGSGIGAATTIYGANKLANSNTEAAQLEAAAKDKELAYLREKDRQDQLNWERTQTFNIDQYNQRLDRLSPYIGMGTAANTTLANLIGGPSMVAATQVQQPHASLPPQAGSPTAPSGDLQTATSLFLDGVQKAGLNPVAVQGHGQQIADAVNRIHPELKLTVDPKSDGIMWNGIPIDVTVDSGKGGWSFRPAVGSAPAAAPRTTASSLFALPSTLATLNDDTRAPMQTPRDNPTTLYNFMGRTAA